MIRELDQDGYDGLDPLHCPAAPSVALHHCHLAPSKSCVETCPSRPAPRAARAPIKGGVTRSELKRHSRLSDSRSQPASEQPARREKLARSSGPCALVYAGKFLAAAASYRAWFQRRDRQHRLGEATPASKSAERVAALAHLRPLALRDSRPKRDLYSSLQQRIERQPTLTCCCTSPCSLSAPGKNAPRAAGRRSRSLSAT